MRHLVAVTPDKFCKGWPGGKEDAFERVELMEALYRVYETDAHCVVYTVGLARQPRLRKEKSHGWSPLIDVLFADVDLPGKTLATPDMVGTVPLETELIYWTKHGYRLVQPLVEPVDADECEGMILTWHAELRERGIDVDPAPKAWNWLFRLPNTSVRTSMAIDASRMRERMFDVRPRTPRPPAKRQASRAAPVLRLDGMAVQDGDRHEFSLTFAGALLESGIHPEDVPSLVRDVSVQLGARDGAHHERNARDTVARDGRIVGLARLRDRWPLIHDALQRALAPPRAPSPPMAEVFAAGGGVTLVKAECGLGKTQAAVEMALARAGMGLKTVFSVPTHSLSEDISKRFHGLPVKRLIGPLSQGSECIHKANAEPLVAGGHSLTRTFCVGCRVANTCKVRAGFIGPEDAPIVIGPHASLGKLTEEAEGVPLIIDEPTPLRVQAELTPEKLSDVLKFIADFDEEFLAVTGVTERVLALRDGELPAGVIPYEKPRLNWRCRGRVRRDLAYATLIGRVSKTLVVVMNASRGVMRRDGERILCSWSDEQLVGALCRDDATFVLDAGADLNVDIYAKVLGYEPKMYTYEAGDGAPIERTWLKRAANRKRWLNSGEGGLRSFDDALKQVFGWANGYPLGIVTFKPLVPRVLAAAKGEYGDIRVAHYGGIRGLDSWKDLVCISTLGDYFVTREVVEDEAAFAGLDADERWASLAAAEAEQAQGRLRTVHRTTPGRALHVGHVRPRGQGWMSDSVRVVTYR